MLTNLELLEIAVDTYPGGPNCLMLRGLTCPRASWQPGQSATGRGDLNTAPLWLPILPDGRTWVTGMSFHPGQDN
ncbi:hypothetical protein AVEN_124042-1 [Araneus ventricosus]|uniref:Uncharacterized protein n=1 Tax=Araneus ventricosus TaxID=182803 RepID=A0A4Y2VC14_ARAVE|nr:hypothetical protein AVEN_124042-1 [Araneus ventricosus]